jgi:hypothetical protein
MTQKKYLLERDRREKRMAKLQRRRQKPKPVGDVRMVPESGQQKA